MLNIRNIDKNNFFEKIVLIIGVLYLYFISRRGGDTRYIFSLMLMGIALIQSFKTGFEKYIFYKKEIIFSIIYLFFICLSFSFTGEKNDKLNDFLNMTVYTIIFMCICLNFKIKDKYCKYFIPLVMLFSLESIFRGLKEMYKNYEILNWYRIGGGNYTTIYAGELSLYVLIGVIAFLYYKEIYKKLLCLMYTGINIFLIIFAQSRAAMFGIPLALIVLFFVLDKKKGIISFILILFLGVFLFKAFPESKPIKRLSTLTSIEKIKGTARMPIYILGIKDGKENMLKGVGFYKYKNERFYVKETGERPPHYHNIFIETFATQGLFALISYIAFLSVIFIRLVKNYFLEDERDRKYIKLLGIAIFIFGIIYGLGEPVFYLRKMNQLIFTIVTMAFIVDETYSGKER